VTVAEAKKLVIAMMRAQIEEAGLNTKLVDPKSPDDDPGKFKLGGLVARVVPPFNGFNVNINQSWFTGSTDSPSIQNGEFYYYAIAIGNRGNTNVVHYYLCDYHKMRDYVLSFNAPKGNNYRGEHHWRGQIHVLSARDRRGYFRWGDEAEDFIDRDRYLLLDNVLEHLQERQEVGLRGPVKTRSFTAEAKKKNDRPIRSRRDVLTEYILRNPAVVGIDAESAGYARHRFESGDTSDILFVSSREICVVEIEEEGAANIHRAIVNVSKLRAVCAVENDLDLYDPKIRVLVVAFDTNYEKTHSLAKRYRVELITVNEKRLY